ncbi:MAG: hypothetical protein ACRDJC_23795 [Thermomicrobiales bacterium]
MTLAFITAPALLLTAIMGTGMLLGGVIVWARNRQRRATHAAASARARDQVGRIETGGRPDATGR